MENASKALIIAGAILLAILIIGLGMFIYQQAIGGINTDRINATEIEAYNSKFENFGEGVITGSQARQLFNTVKRHNITAKDYTQYVKVQMEDASSVTSNGCTEEDTTGTAFNSTFASSINLYAGKTYQVSYGYDANTGYVVAIGFEEQ